MNKTKQSQISDNKINTQLFFAIKNKDSSLVQSLLEQRADVNSALSSGIGETPLMTTARVGDASIAKMLIEAKADLNIKTFYGLKAVDLAESTELQKLLNPATP